MQEQTRNNGINVVGILDEHCEDLEFGGLPLLKVTDLEHRAWDGVLITTLEDLDQAERYLAKAGVAATKVWKLS